MKLNIHFFGYEIRSLDFTFHCLLLMQPIEGGGSEKEERERKCLAAFPSEFPGNDLLNVRRNRRIADSLGSRSCVWISKESRLIFRDFVISWRPKHEG